MRTYAWGAVPIIQSRIPRVRLLLGAAGLLCGGGFAGAACAQAARPVMVQAIAPGAMRQQPAPQADLQALKAEIDALRADLTATKARLADAEKAAGDAHFMSSVAIQWINKNGQAAQAAGQWVASSGAGTANATNWVAANGPAAAAAANWVSANGATVQKVAAAYPTHTHAYEVPVVNFKSRNFVVDSHVTGDDMALGSVITAIVQSPNTTSGPH